MSKMQRDKGKKFERSVAATFRKLSCLANVPVRRSQQGRGAEESDVCIPGLWVECQDARPPTYNPRGKLAQAMADLPDGDPRIPVAITHRTGARSSQVTMRLHDLAKLADSGGRGIHLDSIQTHDTIVTLELWSFLAIYSQAVADGHIDVGAEQEGAA